MFLFLCKNIPIPLDIIPHQGLSSKLIRKIDYFELPVIAHYNIVNEQVRDVDVGVHNLLEENFLVLDVVLNYSPKNTI